MHAQNGETRMSLTPRVFRSLAASFTNSSRTACSALLFSLLFFFERIRRSFLGLQQDERVKTDVCILQHVCKEWSHAGSSI